MKRITSIDLLNKNFLSITIVACVVFSQSIVSNIAYAQPNQTNAFFEFPITVSNGNDSTVLIFGFDEYATSGIDSQFGEYILPEPEPGEFNAGIIIDTIHHIKVQKHIEYGCGWPYRDGLYLIEFDKGAGEEITFRWPSREEFTNIYEIHFIKTNGEILEQYYTNHSGSYTIPADIDENIFIKLYYAIPLSVTYFVILSPNGGEEFAAGIEKTCSWTVLNSYPTTIYLKYSVDNGIIWHNIFKQSLFYSYPWQLPYFYSSLYKFRAGYSECIYDISDSSFSVYSNQNYEDSPLEIPITIRSSVGESQTIYAGIHPQASDKLDDFLNEDTITVSDNSFDAYFILPDNNITHRDLRNGNLSTIGTMQYRIKLQPERVNGLSIDFNLLDKSYAEIRYKLLDGTFITMSFSSFSNIYSFDQRIDYTHPVEFNIFYDAVTPVELTAFTADAVGNDIHLNWETATEENNRGFEIEKRELEKTGTYTWNIISFVEGKGTSAEKSSYSFVDRNVMPGKYFYRLKQIDFNGSFEYSREIEVVINIPQKFTLFQNYPNPFNPATKIKYSVPSVISNLVYQAKNPFVSLKVFDMLGKEITTLVSEEKLPGEYEVEFDAGKYNLSSGIYYYKLSSEKNFLVNKMLLLK